MATATLLKKVLASAFVAAAIAAAAVPGASARSTLLGLGGSSCPSSGTQIFAAWGDTASYFLAPNGGVEGGSTGWSLGGGASVISGNEPFMASGSHALSLPSGSSATSPVICIGPNDPYVRLFGSDSDGGLICPVVPDRGHLPRRPADQLHGVRPRGDVRGPGRPQEALERGKHGLRR